MRRNSFCSLGIGDRAIPLFSDKPENTHTHTHTHTHTSSEWGSCCRPVEHTSQIINCVTVSACVGVSRVEMIRSCQKLPCDESRPAAWEQPDAKSTGDTETQQRARTSRPVYILIPLLSLILSVQHPRSILFLFLCLTCVIMKDVWWWIITGFNQLLKFLELCWFSASKISNLIALVFSNNQYEIPLFETKASSAKTETLKMGLSVIVLLLLLLLLPLSAALTLQLLLLLLLLLSAVLTLQILLLLRVKFAVQNVRNYSFRLLFKSSSLLYGTLQCLLKKSI